MPTYTYECQGCGSMHTQINKISDMNIPEGVPCDRCGGEIKKIITPVGISYNGQTRTVPDWYNDRLKQIDTRYPKGSTTLSNHTKR
jgi:putative FmdB family regulatory protein